MPDAQHVLEGLDPEQREVAIAVGGPVRVLAGAGTGKTRAITHRVAYAVATGEVSPTELLAVTFTTRAAGELRERLARLGVVGVQARTFHSAALRQARYFWPQVYGAELPRVVSSKLGLIGEAVSRCRLKATKSDLRDLAGEIEWAKVTNIRPDDYVRLATSARREVEGYDAATVARIYEAYEDVKGTRQRIDMEDVLLCAAAVLADDERAAAAVRRQYQAFVVDEFQDVSPIQVSLLDLWLGGRDELCVVGDPAQTIYSFAGASADYLLGFPGKFPGTRSITLQRNYRSTPQVIETANTVMAGQIGKAAVELRPTRAEGQQTKLTGYDDEVAEAAAVSRQIQQLIASGVAAEEIAILFRINAQSESFEDALADNAVPFVVRGADRFFERPEVRQAVALLRGAVRAGEGSGDGLVPDVRSTLSAMGWSAQAPSTRGSVRDQWESLQALVSVAEELAAAHPDLDLAGFVAEIQRRAAAQHAPVAAGVTLTTLHAAKGLEWSHVFLVGAHEGTIPIVYADTPQAVDEERRLMYVGVTRARDRLHVSWAAARTPGGRGRRAPSRFLGDLLVGSDQVRAGDARGGPRRRGKSARMAVCRVCTRPLTEPRERKLGRCADCPSSYDEALFDALREWRRERAVEDQVPAYCVFTDATMTALAEMRPRDTDSLVRVPGIGPSKLDKYGPQILQLCASAAAEQGASDAV
ncbi:MAG: ATP-dependent DNA helicase UvrD2 [Nocardioidaceae bacterium]